MWERMKNTIRVYAKHFTLNIYSKNFVENIFIKETNKHCTEKKRGDN